jgi:hypothetical protein
VQRSLKTIQGNVNSTLHSILDEANGILSGMDAQVASVKSLATFVGTAPEYTKCGFVGEFYEEGFEGGICKNFKATLQTTWPFMLSAAICLFVSFLTFACHVRKPAWYYDDPADIALGIPPTPGVGGEPMLGSSIRPVAVV